ncbi:TolC family protein [Melioribacter sp. Ez-97]|uniref:TolC family protein n=1 Tax=Melioribacter sp. Ez-97 TaxID=3423434 RepID=UPI003EDB38E8
MYSKILIMSGIFTLISIFVPLRTATAQETSSISKFYGEFLGESCIDSLAASEKASNKTLKLQDAIIIGLRNNPSLKSKKLEISAFQAAALQAALYPNPIVEIDFENVLGSGDFGGFNAGENTFFITQDFVLGGRLSKAEKVQLINSNLAKWELEKDRLNLISEIRKSFTQISSLQHQNELNKKLLKISKEFLLNLERRIKAGKISPAEASRASLISTSLEIQIQNTEMQLASEKARLKAMLGKPDLQFTSVENICNLRYDIPNLDSLRELILNSPSLAQFKTKMKRVKAAVELEKAKVIPDLSVSLGIRRLNETSDNVLVLGASIPLPIFDDNKGNIQEAMIRENQVKYEFVGAINSAEAKLKFLYNNIKAFGSMIEKLEQESIPSAKDAFKIINEGSSVGRFTVLDVLDAQRSLFELESQYIKAVAEYNQNIIELEALTLTKLDFEVKARTQENE